MMQELRGSGPSPLRYFVLDSRTADVTDGTQFTLVPVAFKYGGGENTLSVRVGTIGEDGNLSGRRFRLLITGMSTAIVNNFYAQKLNLSGSLELGLYYDVYYTDLITGNQTTAKLSAPVTIVPYDSRSVETFCSDGTAFRGDANNTESCNACPSGTGVTKPGACILCPPGTHEVDNGCIPCDAGSFSAAEGLSLDCELCPSNTYAAGTGNTGCTSCPTGFFSDEGAQAPDSCRCPPVGPLLVALIRNQMNLPFRRVGYATQDTIQTVSMRNFAPPVTRVHFPVQTEVPRVCRAHLVSFKAIQDRAAVTFVPRERLRTSLDESTSAKGVWQERSRPKIVRGLHIAVQLRVERMHCLGLEILQSVVRGRLPQVQKAPRVHRVLRESGQWITWTLKFTEIAVLATSSAGSTAPRGSSWTWRMKTRRANLAQKGPRQRLLVRRPQIRA